MVSLPDTDPAVSCGGNQDSAVVFCLRVLAGSRIASWLPSFSVEVMHTTNILGMAQANNSQLMAMVSSNL